MNFREYSVIANANGSLVVLEHDTDTGTCLVASSTAQLDLAEITELFSRHDARCPLVERL